MDGAAEFDKLIRPLKLACRMCGSWPSADDANGIRNTAVYLHRFYRYVVMISLATTVFFSTCEIAVFWGVDMNETIEGSLVTSAFYMANTRMIIFSLRHNDMQRIIETMKRDWTTFSWQDRDLLREKTSLAFKIAKFFTINVAGTALVFVIMPALEMKFSEEEHTKVLPFRGYLFFNYSAFPTAYKSIYVMNSIVGLVGCSTIAAATGFSLLATMHGAAKFAIAQKNFLSLTQSDWKSNEKIGEYVRVHQECIRYAETVERTINFLALAQVLVSTGLVCFAGFQLTTMLEDKQRMTKYGSFLNAAILELFIFSYSGQCLKTESEEIAECTYASEWTGSLSSANIEQIMMRSRKPCTITAGKFYDLSLESFLKVMSSSFSYFTVLLATQEN